MLDFVGNELQVGDRVIYLLHTKTSSHLCESTVTEITSKMVKMLDGRIKTPAHVVKMPPRPLEDHILEVIGKAADQMGSGLNDGHSVAYTTVNAEIQDWPEWKKQAFNTQFAVAAHSHKLPLIADCLFRP